MDAKERWRARWHIFRTVAPAVLVAFVIDVWLSRTTLAQAFGLVSYYVAFFVGFFFLGRWLGTRTWPRRGLSMARNMIRRRIKREHEFLFVSDRPDRSYSTLRRVWEVVGFAAGTSVILSTLVGLVGLSSQSLLVAKFLLPLFVPVFLTWASFVLIPFWLFVRLGIRIVDPVRWLVLPLSTRYADRLRLSNGALVLLGAGAAFNLAFRAGASGTEAVAHAVVLVLRVVWVVAVVAASAVAYYARQEDAIAHQLELDAIAMGIRDGRGMSDGDFLPRLPAQRAR